MGIRDLLVLLDTEADYAARYALWLAGARDLSVTAAFPIVEPRLPAYISAEISAALPLKVREEAEQVADRVLLQFAERAKQNQITAATRTVRALAGEVGREIRRTARYFDMTVLGQNDPDGMRSTEVIESTLFGSGRPILVVPYIFAEPGRLDNILIGWDGGPAAARAVADALPLIRDARRVQIVTVADRSDESIRRSHVEISRHLARHDIEAETRTLITDGDAPNALLSHAADLGADLLVMGGYGHSRMREMVLGGATREILRSMTIPVFMSH